MRWRPDESAGLNLNRDLQADLLIRSRYGCNHEDARSVQEEGGIKPTNDTGSGLVCVLTGPNQSNISSPRKRSLDVGNISESCVEHDKCSQPLKQFGQVGTKQEGDYLQIL